MFNTILKYGSIGGLIVGVPLFAMTVGNLMIHGVMGMVIGYLIMLIALSTVFIAIKRRRDVELGGVIRFWPAFGLGLAISAVAGIIYVVAWEAALAVSGLDFMGSYVEGLIAQQAAAGVTGEALVKFTAEMRAFAADYANPFYRLPMTFTEIFPVGVLVSLVSAGLLCNRRFLAVRRGPQVAAA